MYSLGEMGSVNFTSPRSVAKTCRLQLKLSLENFLFKSLYAVQKSKDYCKADHNNVYCFFINKAMTLEPNGLSRRDELL